MVLRNSMNYSPIIAIGNILVSPKIITEHFCCDYSKCHGTCCIIGDSGAPLEKNECDILAGEFQQFSKHLTIEGIRSVKEQGPFVIDADGDAVTPLVNGEECAYSWFDKDNNCLCGIEKAFEAKCCSMKKPISCWLYPIRVSKLSNGMTALNLHEWYLCMDAFVKGKREGIPVYKFLKDPLIFAFGQDFYKQLEEAASRLF